MLLKDFGQVMAMNTMMSEKMIYDIPTNTLLSRDVLDIANEIYERIKLEEISISCENKNRKNRVETTEPEYDFAYKKVREASKTFVISYYVTLTSGSEYINPSYSMERERIKKGDVFIEHSKDQKSVVLKFDYRYPLSDLDMLNKNDINRLVEGDFSESVYLFNIDIQKKNIQINNYNLKLRESIISNIEKRIAIEKRIMEIQEFLK